MLNASQSEFCPPLVVSTLGQKQKTDGTRDYTETRRLHKRIPLCTGTSKYNLKTSPDSLREWWEILRSCQVLPSRLRANCPFWGYRLESHGSSSLARCRVSSLAVRNGGFACRLHTVSCIVFHCKNCLLCASISTAKLWERMRAGPTASTYRNEKPKNVVVILWQKFYRFKIFTTSRSVNSVVWGRVGVKANVRMLWLFSTSETGDWDEFTFAKTFGTVTRDREKNWPIAD